MLVGSAHRWALMTEHRGAPEPALPLLLRPLSPVDLVIVEGFKREGHPKIEVHRAANGKPWLHPDDPPILAIASDVPPPPTVLRLPFAPWTTRAASPSWRCGRGGRRRAGWGLAVAQLSDDCFAFGGELLARRGGAGADPRTRRRRPPRRSRSR